MTSGILTAFNDKLMVGGIFCDLHKAFDCLNHEILIKKLKYYGIQGKFNALIESYLKGSFQKVILGNFDDNNKVSNWKLIENGVPQGSVLGPLLFLIYINDLPRILNKNTNTILFADDTNILITGSDKKDLKENINVTFHTINTWFNSNRLALNLNKTQILEFQLKHSYSNDIYRLTTNPIEVRFLGLILVDTLSWTKHTDQLTSKLSSACYALRNIRPLLSQVTLKTIYYASVHSLISYGIICWGNSAHAKKVFIIQKNSIRIITNSKITDSC
jgi:hypothetical protein